MSAALLAATAACTTGSSTGGIEGVVTDTDGTAVAKMRVSIVSGTAAFPEVAAVTSDEGRYSLGSIPAGSFQVGVHDQDGERVPLRDVEVSAGETVTLDFVVPAMTQGVTADNLARLLTIDDLRVVLVETVDVHSTSRDLKAMAQEADPAQVVDIDTWYGLTFESDETTGGLTLSVIDFDTPESARDHFDLVKAETPGLSATENSIGDASAAVVVNDQGIGSILVFLQGDRFVQLHTSGTPPMVDLPGLEHLARVVAGRL
jgi:hypothetical protein